MEKNVLKPSPDPNIRQLHAWIDSHQEEIVTALQGVLRIPSVEGPAAPGAPFGRTVREALDYTLALADRLGFRTKDVDGYAGHAEFGEGAEMIAAVGHLDVVPEGEGWEHPPYGAEIENGYIYARGSADDKGPTYAALFGAKALLDSGLPLRRRVRVIFGCDEESGFGCVKHYWEVAKEERPIYAFTPDAGFPMIYAEKGITNLVLEKELPQSDAPLRIAQAFGGLRPNMVPDSAEAQLTGTPEALYGAVGALQKYWDKNVSFEAREDGLIVRATGKSSHGSRPAGGDNAVARLARALATLDLPEREVWLAFVAETVDPTGAALGIAARDDVAGPLTSNLGVLEYTENGRVRLTYNIRYPVTSNIATVTEANRPVREKAGWTLAEVHDQPPLYVPLDQEPVATLLRVYREETGDTESQPGTMGGGTYARATPHAVAYGAGFPWSHDGPAHEPDERFALSTLLDAAKIYAHALYELAK
ncbi:MAG TPA: dipeptidase PepV [Chthonomonadaceae bacterium]|nr:dipeptidase PepV [Chthonomonadaceae bacterium]